MRTNGPKEIALSIRTKKSTMKTDETGQMVEFSDFPELETRRLVLRRLMLADAEFYLRHFSDPDIVELTAFDAPENIERATQELIEFCVKPFEENKGIRWGYRPERRNGIGRHHWVSSLG